MLAQSIRRRKDALQSSEDGARRVLGLGLKCLKSARERDEVRVINSSVNEVRMEVVRGNYICKRVCFYFLNHRRFSLLLRHLTTVLQH